MNTLSMRKFFTRERYVEKSNLPPSLEGPVFARLHGIPDKHGNPTHEEADIDASVDQELGRCRPTPPTPPERKLGRKPTTHDAAVFAEQLQESGVPWKDIARQVNARYGTTFKSQNMRAAVYRLKKREGRR